MSTSAPTPHEWIGAQTHREDVVGRIARLACDSPRDNPVGDFWIWLQNLADKAGETSAAIQARTEFEACATDLSTNGYSPTFPRWMAEHRFDAVLKESWPRHRHEPHVSIAQYHHRRQKELRQEIERRTLIYLDTCHWIKMREAALHTAQAHPSYGRILELLRAKVSEGKILCPCSELLFAELLKIGDPNRRRATASLIDDLSNGVCLRPLRAIEQVELKRRILQVVLGEAAPDLAEWVWTKGFWVLGEMLPDVSVLGECERNTIKKVFTDIVWSSKVSDLVEFVPTAIPSPIEPRLVDAFNGDASSYRDKNTGFDDVLKAEKALLLHDLLTADLHRIADEVWEQFPAQSAACVGRMPAQTPDPWMTPTIQILAAIHASFFISSRSMKIEVNDLLDARHAAVALPYCDCLFVERPLAHRLTIKPLQFDKVYQTEVISEPDEFLIWLTANAV